MLETGDEMRMMVEKLWCRIIKCLKVGMRGQCGCGVLSRSRRLGASSIPLEPRLSVQPCVRPMQLQEPS